MLIYHITARTDWTAAQAKGEYVVASLDLEGFIHASTYDQILDTARRFYRGRTGLVLLCIDTAKVRPEVRFDPVHIEGFETKFPHIYGPLNLDAVVSVVEFEPDENGGFHYPAGLAH